MMTLERVRDTLCEESKFQHATSHHVTCMMLDKLADAIDAHLTQQTDLAAIREVIGIAKFMGQSVIADKLARSIGDKP